MKYLIAGLGNIGPEYENTRHNIGFKIVEALASTTDFEPTRYGDTARVKFKGRTLVLLKPSTFMNLSGKAVAYWLQKEKISEENLMVVTDDLALPFGKIRMRAKGSDGGHNGLKSINEHLGTTQYPRLRFGVGDGFPKGGQVNYVLSEWTPDEKTELETRIDLCCEAIRSYTAIGINRAMSEYNNK